MRLGILPDVMATLTRRARVGGPGCRTCDAAQRFLSVPSYAFVVKLGCFSSLCTICMRSTFCTRNPSLQAREVGSVVQAPSAADHPHQRMGRVGAPREVLCNHSPLMTMPSAVSAFHLQPCPLQRRWDTQGALPSARSPCGRAWSGKRSCRSSYGSRGRSAMLLNLCHRAILCLVLHSFAKS